MIKSTGSIFLLSLVISSPSAFAGEPLCDVRQMDLTHAQKETLKEIRLQNRQYTRQLKPSSQQIREYNRQIKQLLKQDKFDVAQATRLVQEKYRLPIQHDVAQLHLVSSLLEVLDQEQRDEWLEKCTY